MDWGVESSFGRLSKNVVLALTANGVQTAAQIGIFILLAKLAAPSLVGKYALALAIVTPPMLLAKLQLRPVLATDFAGDYRFGDYCGARLSASLLVAVILPGAALTCFSHEVVAVLAAVVAIKATESVSDLLHGVLQRDDHWNQITRASAIRSLGVVPSFWLAWQWTESLPVSLTVTAAWSLAVLVARELPVAREALAQRRESARPLWNTRIQWKLFRTVLPLGLVGALISFIANTPRYFVEHYLGQEELGYFAALLHLTMVGGLLLQAAGQAVMPRMARHAGHDRRGFVGLALLLLGFAGLLGAGGTIAASLMGARLLAVIYRPEYAAHQELLVWLMAGAAVSYLSSSLGYMLTSLRLFQQQLPVYLVTAAAALLSCMLLIPAHGLMGAAYACLATWLVALLGGAAVLAANGWVGSERGGGRGPQTSANAQRAARSEDASSIIAIR